LLYIKIGVRISYIQLSPKSRHRDRVGRDTQYWNLMPSHSAVTCEPAALRQKVGLRRYHVWLLMLIAVLNRHLCARARCLRVSLNYSHHTIRNITFCSESFRIDARFCFFLTERMKSVLGCLMCLVFTTSQSFAISGGPFNGPTHVNVVGTYAGVFVPTVTVIVLSPGPPPVTQTVGPDPNSLALFTLSVPKTDLASGTAVIFRNGFFYLGMIQASADPDSGTLTGIINGTATETTSEVGNVTNLTLSAAGQFQNAKILANQMTSVSAARIRGKASITYITVPSGADPRGESPRPILYKVHGFKQSTSSS
jgi:hypothetical protein